MKSQLFMRNDNLDNLPEIVFPDNISLITHSSGMEKEWESLIESTFESFYSFEKMLINWKGYAPENVFYLVSDEKIIATASAVENPDFEGYGWLHMVAADTKMKGMGLGKIVTLAVLHSFAKRGFKSVVLSTDDFRLPAIATYLKSGFSPIYLDDTHEERWKKVMEKIK